MKRNKWNHLPLLLIGAALLVTLGGCPAPTPPAEAVLEGVWELVPGDEFEPALTNWLLTFDENGDLTQISYTFEGAATVTWNNPPAATSVNGTAVYISATQGGNGLTFSGTLDATNTVITGTLTSTLAVGGITITVDQGSATLTKQ